MYQSIRQRECSCTYSPAHIRVTHISYAHSDTMCGHGLCVGLMGVAVGAKEFGPRPACRISRRGDSKGERRSTDHTIRDGRGRGAPSAARRRQSLLKGVTNGRGYETPGRVTPLEALPLEARGNQWHGELMLHRVPLWHRRGDSRSYPVPGPRRRIVGPCVTQCAQRLQWERLTGGRTEACNTARHEGTQCNGSIQG